MYNKSNHFNAARRLKKASKRFKYGLIIGSLLAFVATIMNLGVWDAIPNVGIGWQILANTAGAIGASVILYSTTFGDYYNKMQLASKHQSVGVELNLVFKEIRNVEASYKDGYIDGAKLQRKLDSLSELYIAKTQGAPITEDKDYEKTKLQYADGNLTDYTEEELNA